MASNSTQFEGGVNERALDSLRTNADIEINRQDNQSRKAIAYWFTAAFVILNTIIIIGTPIYNAIVGLELALNISEVLSKFNGFFGTLLGFVLGYYFKK